MSQTPPQTLGKYQVIREIARSNDIVYEAFDPQMNRRVALKELAFPPGATETQRQERLSRFMREAKAAGSLAHPNIVTVYDVDQDGDRTFLAMEYLTGHNLRNALDTKGQIAPERAVEIAIEVLKGLEFAHANGVVHRDIKPDNVQILDGGQIKITDFGIARLTFEPNLTMDGQVFGTPSYMSPEQIHGREIDARSDLFSLGVVLYEMVAGTKPFVGDNVVAISHAILNHAPPQPQAAGFPLWQAILRAVEKTPSQRFASAKEMQAALEDVLSQMRSGTVVVTSPVPPVAQPTVLAQAPAPYGQPYGAGPYGQPYGQPPAPGQPQPVPYLPPVYYRVPRPPLLSPQARSVLARVAAATVLVASVLALAAAMVVAIVKLVSSAESSGIPSSPSAEAPAASARDAAFELDAARRQRLWSEASRHWASQIEADPAGGREAAVRAYLRAAADAAAAGRQLGAWEALAEAESFALESPMLMSEVSAARARLGLNAPR